MADFTKQSIIDLEEIAKTIINKIDVTKDLTKLPRYRIKNTFFYERTKRLDENIRFLSKFNSQTSAFQLFQEFRMAKLFFLLNESNTKFLKFYEEKTDFIENTTSQLCIVYEIIKNSRELLSLIYILKWLEEIYLKKSQNVNTEQRKFFFSKEFEEKKKNDLNPDVFNEPRLSVNFQCNPKWDDANEYLRVLEKIMLLVRSGQMYEAQEFAKYNNLNNISAILSGGLPLNDFLFDDLSKISKMDFEIFPNYMKNREFYLIKEKITIGKEIDENIDKNIFEEDNTIGNPNWISWLHANYELANNELRSLEADSFRSKKLSDSLQSFISGNSRIFQHLADFDVYDWLYTRFLNLFNFRLITEYLSIDKIDLHFVDNPDLREYIFKNQGDSVEKIINELQNMEIYKNEISSNDFLLDIDLEVIKAHFKYEINDKFTNLENIIFKIDSYVRSNALVEYIKKQFKLQIAYNKLNTEQGDLMMNAYLKSSIVNYSKMIFINQIGIYLIFEPFFSSNIEFGELIERQRKTIANPFDLIERQKRLNANSGKLLGNFYRKIIDLVRENKDISPLCVYILAFLNDIEVIIQYLIELVSQLITPEEFKSMIGEIDTHFYPFTEIINQSLANKSKICQIMHSFQNIDDVLASYMKGNREIQYEDKLKIQKAYLLFSQENVVLSTHLRHILILALKFLQNKKFIECTKTLDDFRDTLENKTIIINLHSICKEFDSENFFLNEESVIYNIFENYSEDLKIKFELRDSIPICFCKELISLTNDCFFSYFTLFEEVEKSNITESSKKNHVNKILSRFETFIKLVKYYNFNLFLRAEVIDLFENEKDEIVRVIGEWIFQICKWTLNLFYDNNFKQFSGDKSFCLNHLNNYINAYEEFLVNEFLNKGNNLVFKLEQSILTFLSVSNTINIFKFIYESSKRNDLFIIDIFDSKLGAGLKEEIEEYDGFPC